METISSRVIAAIASALVAASVNVPAAAGTPAPATIEPSLLYQNCNTSTGLLGFLSGTSDDAKTKYPIVLVSGGTGTPNWLVPGGHYWYQIPETLCKNGATVYVASIAPVNDNNVRGEELLAQVKMLMAQLKVDRVNLVGHSMGGQAARYVAAVYPEGVASVTTVSAVHKGSEMIQYMLDNGPVVQDLSEIVALVTGIAGDVLNGQNYPLDVQAAMNQTTTAGELAWNKMFPSAGLSSASCVGADDDTGTRKDTDTRIGTDGKTYVQKLYSFSGDTPVPLSLDVVGNSLMGITSAMMKSEGAGKNDGVVSVCSGRFGQVTGTYHWNHLNEINNMFGLTPILEAKPTAVYVALANRLKQAGM